MCCPLLCGNHREIGIEISSRSCVPVFLESPNLKGWTCKYKSTGVPYSRKFTFFWTPSPGLGRVGGEAAHTHSFHAGPWAIYGSTILGA